jgi:hypothetical protein
MKSSIVIISLLIATCNLYGQRMQYFVNDTLVVTGDDHCWSLTHKFNAPYLGNLNCILDAEIAGYNLKLTINLGGGCGPNYFKLFLDNSFDVINDSIIRLSPVTKSDDPCSADLFIELCFNIEELIRTRNKPLLLKIGKFELIIDKK